jgi:preprotein translocase subunit SecG
MFTFLLVVQIIVSISIISLVMLQQGKGADMGAAFGSGASGTVFGARGSGSFFSRATGILAAVFFINCLLIASPLIRDTVNERDSIAEKIEEQQAARQQAAEQKEVEDQVMKPLEELEKEAADLPADIPALADQPPAQAGAAEAPTAGGGAEKPAATPGAAEDLPE